MLFKVAGYADSAQQQNKAGSVELHDQHTGSQISALHALVGFMSGLTNADADGRIILDRATCSLKFVLLNAAAHFSKVQSFLTLHAYRDMLIATAKHPFTDIVSQTPWFPRASSYKVSATEEMYTMVHLPASLFRRQSFRVFCASATRNLHKASASAACHPDWDQL